MFTASTKTKVGAKALTRVARNPGVLRVAPPTARLGSKVAKPLAKRRAHKRAERVGEAARGIATTTAAYAPSLVRVIDALAPPKRKRLAPRVGAGVVLGTGAVLGAAAVYLLAPGGGREHRRQLRRLMS
jgi:hypothetical protein